MIELLCWSRTHTLPPSFYRCNPQEKDAFSMSMTGPRVNTPLMGLLKWKTQNSFHNKKEQKYKTVEKKKVSSPWAVQNNEQTTGWTVTLSKLQPQKEEIQLEKADKTDHLLTLHHNSKDWSSVQVMLVWATFSGSSPWPSHCVKTSGFSLANYIFSKEVIQILIDIRHTYTDQHMKMHGCTSLS